MNKRIRVNGTLYESVGADKSFSKEFCRTVRGKKVAILGEVEADLINNDDSSEVVISLTSYNDNGEHESEGGYPEATPDEAKKVYDQFVKKMNKPEGYFEDTEDLELYVAEVCEDLEIDFWTNY